MLLELGIVGLILMESSEKNSKDPMPNWRRWDPLFKKYGTQFGVNWKWAKAICLNESLLGNEKSVARGLLHPTDIEGSKSYDGLSWGLMQVTVGTAKDMDPTATPEKLNNAEYSIRIGTQYIGWLMKRFSSLDPRYIEWVIKSYNQGPGNTNKEISTGKGFASEYWSRFQRNLKLVEENL